MAKETKYQDYSALDFLKDEFFVKWVSEKEPALNDFWEKWINEHPEKKDTIQEAKQLVRSFQYKETISLDDDEYINLYERILKRNPGSTANKKSGFTKGYLVAAAILFMILTFLGVFFFEKQSSSQNLVSFESKSTNYGEKLTIRLSDGTIVRLNAGSKIEYRTIFDSRVREVKLTGEAFFDIAEDKESPFIVHTSKMSVEALGTSFNVNSYLENSSHVVTLVTGKVSVSHKENEGFKILSPGQEASVGRDENILISEVGDASAIDWTNGVLAFNATNFGEVIAKLERWYGVTIKVNGTIPSLEAFSGRFENENLESILEVLAYSSSFTYTLENKNVTINFK